MTRSFLLTCLLAYVMPAQSVLRRMVEARHDMRLNDLTLTGTAKVAPGLAREVGELVGTTWASGDLSVNFKLTLKIPGRCKLELIGPETGKSVTISVDNDKSAAVATPLKGAQLGLIEACALLASKGAEPAQTRNLWEAHLQTRNIDTRSSALGRFNGAIALVIGDTRTPGAQLWVYKNRFLPARIKLPEGDKNSGWDIRFLDYNNQATSDAFPRAVEVFRGAEQQWRFLVLNAEPLRETDSVKKSK